MTRYLETYERKSKDGLGRRILFIAKRPSQIDNLEEALLSFSAKMRGKGDCELRDCGDFDFYFIGELSENNIRCGVLASPGEDWVLVGFRTDAGMPRGKAIAVLDYYADLFVEITGMRELKIKPPMMIRDVADTYFKMLGMQRP